MKKYLHTRCTKNIVNLILQDPSKGKDEHSCISQYKGVVFRIPQLDTKKLCESCVEIEKIETNKL